jgi:hypothetical protein
MTGLGCAVPANRGLTQVPTLLMPLVSSELVSTMGVDDEGFLKHTIGGTTADSQLLDMGTSALHDESR